MSPDEMMGRLLYRDGLMLVIDKPYGMPVHRGPQSAQGRGRGTLEEHFDALRFGLPRPPALAHRLDRETAGCLVLGRHRKALAHLGLLFKHGRIGKTYWAMVEGGPADDEGEIDLPLGRLNAERGWWMKVDPAGLPSRTRWRVLGRSRGAAIGDASDKPRDDRISLPHGRSAPSPLVGEGWGGGLIAGASPDNTPTPDPSPQGGGEQSGVRGAISRDLTWLALTPVTGRTHQLRVHCAARGWPIVGDAIYGTAPRENGPGLQLLSREIVVPIQKNKPAVAVTAPVPPHMREWLTACGLAETLHQNIPPGMS